MGSRRPVKAGSHRPVEAGRRRPLEAGSRRRTARRVVFGLAAAVLTGMGAVLLTPWPVDQPIYGKVLRAIRQLQEHGFPGWLDYATVEAAANVLLRSEERRVGKECPV